MDPLQNDTTPKTANLLACKQWWKVCFIKGDQEKYYRQIYGRAAAERMARFHRENGDNLSPNQSRIIFPTKLHPPIMLDRYTGNSFRLDGACNESALNQISALTAKSVVNIFDDPFLFGINDRHENGSDSGIDATFTFKRPSTRDLTRLDEPTSVGLQSSSSPAPPIPSKPNRSRAENLLSSPKLAHATTSEQQQHDDSKSMSLPLDSSFGAQAASSSDLLSKTNDDDTYSPLDNFTWYPPGLSYDHVSEREKTMSNNAVFFILQLKKIYKKTFTESSHFIEKKLFSACRFCCTIPHFRKTKCPMSTASVNDIASSSFSSNCHRRTMRFAIVIRSPTRKPQS